MKRRKVLDVRAVAKARAADLRLATCTLFCASVAVLAGGSLASAQNLSALTIGVLNDQSSVYADSQGIGSVIAARLAAEDYAKSLGVNVEVVYADWGSSQQRPLGRVTTQDLRRAEFPAGSMGPKVDAACRFVEATGGRAAIGALTQIQQIVDGEAGTQVVSEMEER